MLRRIALQLKLMLPFTTLSLSSWVEPSFATLKRNPEADVHGVSTLFSVEDAIKLNNMEPPNIEVCTAVLYDEKTELDVEVYLPRTPLALDHPEGCCSGSRFSTAPFFVLFLLCA